MTTVKFQSESTTSPGFVSSRLENRLSTSEESLIANLESIILAISIRNGLSQFDELVLDSLFSGDDRLMIVKENECIYPQGSHLGDFSFCLIIKDGQLNFCDLTANHEELVNRIEHAWLSLLTAAVRVADVFENSDASILVNRTSGRIIAVSKSFTAISGIDEEKAVGQEYGEVSIEFSRCFVGKKIKIENFSTDEVYLTLVSITAVPRQTLSNPDSNQLPAVSNENSHRLINEEQTIGLHFNRFNALLETNLQVSISPETLDKLESVISEMTDYCADQSQTMHAQIDSSNIKASLRLLIQSVLMSHRSLAGESARTDVVVNRDAKNALQIKFDTPTLMESHPQAKMNEWWQLVRNLSKRIDVRIGELQFTGNSIINRIYLTTEGAKADEKK